jgi:hypothetical protein
MSDSAPTPDELPFARLAIEQFPDLTAGTLERRIQRLESEVDALKDTRVLEDRIAVRVTERLQKTMRSEAFTAAGRSTIPDTDVTKTPRARYAWLFVDMLADARLLFVMLLDRRYGLAWTTHLVVWFFIPAILTSGWWFPLAYIPLLGVYLDKEFDLLLAFCVYKALSRELHRYKSIIEPRL